MGTSKRFLALCAAGATAVSAVAAGCNDNDQTQVCVGPGCANYDGVGGNFFHDNEPPLGGSGGDGGNPAEEIPDGGVEPSDAAVPEPDADVPPPDAGENPPPACELAFTGPLAGSAGPLTLDGSSDVDGEACGSEFVTTVALTSNAASVTLFINDNPLAPQAVVAGAVTFDAPLGNRGSTGNTLRAVATMADSRTCTVTLPDPLFVDCPGPSCSVESPVASDEGYLNASQDGDGAVGFQTDISVVTEVAHVNQTVRLEIDGTFDDDTAVVLEDDGEGVATFGNLSLAEGERTVRAECTDAFGLTTLSAPITWNVDITPCTLTIDSVAGGADPITPGDDVSGDPGLQVLVTGEILGADCKTLWIGPCDGAAVPIPLVTPPDGDFSLPVTLTGDTGSLSLCGAVEDEAGNMGDEDQVSVDLRLDAPQVAFASPTGSVRYNAAGTGGALADGNGSSGSCEATFVVNCTEVNTSVELLEDGTPIATANCAAGGAPDPFSGQATFSQVSLASRNDGSSSVLTARQTVTGLPPGVSSGITVTADCEAPSCSIVSPSAALSFLTADSSGDPGFQFDFEVQSDVNSTGQTVTLVVDGDVGGAVTSPLVAGGGGGAPSATFSNVTLDQGLQSVQARCVDAAGNEASATEDWTVDSVACSATGITFAGGISPIIPASDSNVDPGLQVTTAGQATGGDCTGARIGICNALSGPFVALAGDQSFLGLEPTLASTTGTQDVCIEIEDAAGNVGLVQTTVAVRVDLPTATITSPADEATFNTLSANGCDTDVVVTCSDAGGPVELLVDGAAEDSANCGIDNQVTFPLSLASKNDGSATTLTVRHGADGLTSLDSTIEVQADCEAPVLSFSDPACGDQLALAGDDVGPDPDLQMDVIVLNDGAPEVTLTVTRGTTGVDRTETGNASATTFPAADLGTAGSITLSACATDAQGNEGCTASCALTIVAEPTISITSPAASTVLSSGTPDCDLAPGLQVTVTGTTDAADGSDVVVQLGVGAPQAVVASAGAFSACVEAPEGNAQTLAASVTDANSTLEGTTSIQVSVDTIAPGSTIAAPATALLDRRRGTVELTWSSILDSDGDALAAYRLRCANSDITTESDWTAATELPVALTPASSAAVSQTEDVVGLVKAGMSRFCVMRGEDDGGQLSPITSGLSLTLSNPFRTQQYAVTDDTGGTNLVNVVVEPLGDIDGDGIADFAYGTANLGVEIFLGKTDLDDSLVDVKAADFTIRNTTAVGATLGFGSEVAGLGDINGDSRPDFAVSARGANTVFVFFGRTSTSPWSDITLTSMTPCQADLCIVGSGVGAGSGLFGWDVGSANFDGAGPQDLVIAGRSVASTQTNAGRVFVLLGGTQLATSGTTITVPADNPEGFIIDPPAGRTAFGVSFAAVTGTGGVDDLIIGSNGSLPSTPSATDATANRVTGRAYPGPSGLVTINANSEFENGPVGNYGNPVRALGDFDGDGRGDLAVGRNGNQGGIINLYRGLASGGFNNQAGNLLTFANELFPGFDDNHGQFTAQGFIPGLGTLGDLDLDGRTELFTGSTTPDLGGARGSSNLFYGSASPATSRTRASADFTYTPTNTQVLPNFVGDINNDTFPDVAVLDSGTGANVIFVMY